MSVFFSLLFVASLLSLIVGLIRPELFTFILKEKSSRQTVAIIFGSATVLFMIVAGALAEPKSDPIQVRDLQRPVAKTVEETETIPFDTTEKDEPSMPEGDTKVQQEGKLGERLIKYKIAFVDGVEKSRQMISKEITMKPTDEIILVGTQKTETSTPEPVPFTTQTNNDPNMD